MSLKKTKSILLNDKEDTVGVIKLASVYKPKATLGLDKTKKWLADTAYKRAASIAYTKAMKKPPK